MFKQNVFNVHLVFENVGCLQNMFILIFTLLEFFIPLYVFLIQLLIYSATLQIKNK